MNPKLNTFVAKTEINKKYKKQSQAWEIFRRMMKNKGAVLGMIIVIALITLALSADFLFEYDTDVIGVNISNRLQSPSMAHPFGTDELGRDMFARVLYATRYSLLIGFSAVVVSVLVGLLIGSIAGYYGGVIEEVIMRLNDMIGSIPYVLLAIVIVSVMGRNLLNLILAIGLTSVPKFVRISRASVLTVRNQEFTEAARAIGLPNSTIIMKHIIPNALSPIIVQTTLNMANAIISASSLSYLGLGIPAPAPEWGSLLSAGRDFLRDYSYMCLFPGLAIMVTVLALNLMGDGLRDALDPKLKT